MTAERLTDGGVGQPLSQVLNAEANTIDLPDAGDAIASRLLATDPPGVPDSAR